MNHPYSTETQAVVAAEFDTTRSPGTNWIIVAQVKSNRVVYFTDDPEYQPAMDGDWYFVSQYLGELPAAMTLRNCWSWRFNGGVFKDVREPEAKPLLQRMLDSNRSALLALLRDKVSQARNRFAATCALGNDVRHLKHAEAQRYLNETGASSSEGDTGQFPMLSAVATARGIALQEAASLIEHRHQNTLRMLEQTEQVREHYVQAIHRAQTQEDMFRLRRELLDTVLPDLSARFKFPAAPFEPGDWSKPLSEVHKIHETARLRAQLRGIINAKRAALHDGYLGGDLIARRRLEQAQALLKNDSCCSEQDCALVESHARQMGMLPIDAAKQLVQANHDAEATLISTELLKDAMLGRIDAIANLRDIRTIGEVLEALAAGKEPAIA
ncbi:hypothetical protein PI87_02605 [Ralstonia sp. A12]|uniref:hypothetical protein n=1 Tax=Ralstonia sp. A12 TaxID=1217052 RepID=UPI00057377C9|nr:hypothetical protein [Ralstonia sp. A12]KHK58657.1 hypothetical protein PI87_02605 [Ralstonia sp. A12]